MMDVADYRLRLAIVFELKTLGVKPGRLSKAELRVRQPTHVERLGCTQRSVHMGRRGSGGTRLRETKKKKKGVETLDV